MRRGCAPDPLGELMAIYHLSAQVVSRTNGASAVAGPAYRAGESLVDERTGVVHDYTRRERVFHSEIMLPPGAPEAFKHRQVLWNAVEASEKRKDSQLLRELNVALPRELSQSQQLELVRQFVATKFVAFGMCADFALHDLKSENPHAHISVTLRDVGPSGFGKKNTDWNHPKFLWGWRQAWEVQCNNALAAANRAERIDCRTLAAQGIDRLPQKKLGRAGHAELRKGEKSGAVDAFFDVLEVNEQLAELAELEAELATIDGEIHEYRESFKASQGPAVDGRRVGAAGVGPGPAGGPVVGTDRGGQDDDRDGGHGSRQSDWRGAAQRDQRGDDGRQTDEIYSGGAVHSVGELDGGHAHSAAAAVGGASPLGAVYGGGHRDSGYERILALAGVADPRRKRRRATDVEGADMPSSTDEAVAAQLAAMRCKGYEVGVNNATKGMLLRQWSAEQVRKGVAWLKRQNVLGEDVYIRPDRSMPSDLILVDDLDAAAVRGLAAKGLEPALVLRTSAGNHQAWVRIAGGAVPPNQRTLIAKALAAELGGDPNAADHAHFGRLAGFTNRKLERMVRGQHPFVKVIDSDPGAVATRSAELLSAAMAELTRLHSVEVRAEVGTLLDGLRSQPNGAQSARGLAAGPWYQKAVARLQERFGAGYDASKADWWLSVGMLKAGYGQDAVAAALREHSPGLGARKGRNVGDYLEATVGKASVWIQLEAKGYKFADVKHQLLDLAKQQRGEMERPNFSRPAP